MLVRHIPVRGRVGSLMWDGDDLVDVSYGPRRWLPDGTAQEPKIPRAFYPVALGALPDGREVVVHCPEEYNVLQMEDAASGQRLTAGIRAPQDVFHSRLVMSPGGRFLLMTGWVWQPYGMGLVFDLQAALADPTVLDGDGLLAFHEATFDEVVSGCWLDDDRLVVTTASSAVLDGQPGDGELWVWSLSAGTWIHRSTAAAPMGTLIGCGENVVALYGHPRLIDPAAGRVLMEWPQVDAGNKSLCYGFAEVTSRLAVCEPDGSRLAIVQDAGIAVIDVRAPQRL